MKALSVVLAVLFALFGACDKIPGAPQLPKLTEKKVKSYIKAQKNLQKLGPDVARQFSDPTRIDFDQASKEFSKVDKAVKGAGFESYADFVATNAVIAKVWSDMQAGKFMEQMDDMQAAGAKQIQEAIDNPDTPPETKAQLKKQLAEMKSTYADNKQWADMVMEYSGGDIDPETARILKKHEKDLLEVMTYGAVKAKK